MYVTQLSGIGQCDSYWVSQCKYRNLQNIKKSSINILSIFKLMHISVVAHCLILVMETFQKLVLSASSCRNRELLGLDKQKDLLFISRIISPDGKTKQVSKTLRFCYWNEIMTKSNECVSLMTHHHHHRFLASVKLWAQEASHYESYCFLLTLLRGLLPCSAGCRHCTSASCRRRGSDWEEGLWMVWFALVNVSVPGSDKLSTER